MRKTLILLIAALALPAAALAKGPNPHSTSTNGKAKVMYILRGTLSGYSAYAAGPPSVNGTITIQVVSSNRHGRTLKGSSEGPLVVGAKTRIKLKHGLTTITDGDRGIVKIRAARVSFKDPNLASDLASALGAGTVVQVIDRGPAS